MADTRWLKLGEGSEIFKKECWPVFQQRFGQRCVIEVAPKAVRVAQHQMRVSHQAC